MNSNFLNRLHSPERPVIVFDGAMGTNLQVQNLTAEDFGGKEYEGCNEYLVHTKPESVAKVHRDFLAAGADVIETDTFGGTKIVLAEYDLADQAYYLNKTAAELAKSAAAAYSTPEKPRFVAGSMGPGTKLPTLGHIDFATLKNGFTEQAEGLFDGGSRFIYCGNLSGCFANKSCFKCHRRNLWEKRRSPTYYGINNNGIFWNYVSWFRN